MNYGLYLSAASALSEIHRQEVITNNLVNSQTAGFKPDTVYGRTRLPERLESHAAVDPQLLLERLGGSPTLDPTYISRAQGALLETGGELDVALDGEGFLVVRGLDGHPRLTRDGRLALNTDGDLVMAGNGLRVLDSQNRPIQLLGDKPVEIDARGQVLQDGRSRGDLRITPPIDPRDLVKEGDNLLRHRAGNPPAGQPEARLVQRYIEQSAVDAVTTLKDLLVVSRSAAGAVRMMQYHDNIMGQAINTLGRVA